jgi:prepilin-type N-terminal cleavage/methylation domain-containing protein
MNAIEQRKRNMGQGGFTLIELLVVIAILGVLAGVVVFAVGGISNTSKDAACKAEVSTVDTAIQSFYAQENSYPTDDLDETTADLTANPPKNAKPFVPAFLKTEPTYVDIVYNASDDQAEPTVNWTAKAEAANCGDEGDPASNG